MKFTFLLSVLIAAASFLSCEPEPEVIIQTVTITDTVTIVETITDTFPETATTFILVRHAETTGGGSDPSLGTAGLARAAELSNVLDNISLTAVFATSFNRTQETAALTASDQGLTVENYNASDLNTIADLVLADHHEEVVLIVGHSNTTPDLINILVGETIYADLPETEYDNLFIVTSYEKGISDVLHLKYGD